MKVILKEEITRVGNAGDVVQVSDGFARNYLFPQNKAMPATSQNIRNLEHYRKSLLKKQSNQKGFLEEIAKKLIETECVITKKAGKNNKLFGSVTAQDIYNTLLNKGFKIDRRCIQLESPIKEIGEFQVNVRLHSEVKAMLKVTVKTAAS